MEHGKILKPGQLFTFRKRVYQVKKTHPGKLSCDECHKTVKFVAIKALLCSVCCEHTRPRTHLKLIK